MFTFLNSISNFKRYKNFIYVRDIIEDNHGNWIQFRTNVLYEWEYAI